jgi:glutamine cyclotransferase
VKIILLNFILGFLIIVSSCSNNKHNKTHDNSEKTKSKIVNKTIKHDIIKISLNKKKQYFTGDKIIVNIKYLSDTIKFDSIVVFVNNKKKPEINISNNSFIIKTSDLQVGNCNIKASVYKEKNIIDESYLQINLLSDIEAINYKAKIINKYNHDPKAYTQGLFIDNGILYEGTGQYGASTLRKVELETGKLIESLKIAQKYFGEGITAFDNKIIQLTWRSRIGFIYNKENFELINKVQYPTEGWGITFDGDKLFMSDGSSTLHILNPEYFYKIGDLTVCDNSSKIKMLNELEYINGNIYANIWQTDFIVIINPKNGKVIGKIDCSNLVPEKYKNEVDLVLNGIAYDKINDRLFVTGKMWDVLYEIKIEKI